MSDEPVSHTRKERADDLRADWRKGEGSRGASDGLTDDEELDRERAALDASDRIRAEAPEDLETRRRSDQLEREIRQSEKHRGV